MALPQVQHDEFITEEEYLAFEAQAEFKHEYANGEIIAMTGASWNHNLITSNITNALGNQLRDTPCTVVASDMRVKAKAAHSYRYPDVSVVCGEPHISEDKPGSLLNPVLLVEVLSDTTAVQDRGDKLREYRQIETLQVYLLVAQDEARVEMYARQPKGDAWLYTDAVGTEGELALPALGCTLELVEVYRKVSFDAATTAPDNSET